MKTKEQKRKEAETRQMKHDALSPAQQLEKAKAINPNSKQVKRLTKKLK